MNIIKKDDLERGYDIIKQCIDYYIKSHNIEFISSEIAPNDFEGMKAYYNDFGKFLVFNGGNHGYLGQEYNIKFRALHDYMHIKYDLTFKYNDEKRLSDITANKFMNIAYNQLNCTHWELYLVKSIINAEIKGQIEYYEKNKDKIPTNLMKAIKEQLIVEPKVNKEYVKDQKEFINDYLQIA